MNKNQTPKTTCLCGCAQPTINPAANYRPGHDAAHVSNLLAIIAQKSGGFSQDDVNTLMVQLPSLALKVKFQNAADRLADRRSGKDKPKKDAGTWMDVDHTVAKVGRWTYPVQEWVLVTRTGDQPTGEFQRNTKRDGTGEWVAVDTADLITE